MACQYGLHNWILTSVLWIVHSFTRWTLQWFWRNLNFTLGMHTPKNYCFDVQPFKHQIPIYFCKLSLWHLQHIPRNWFSIPDHVHDYSQAWVGLTCRCSDGHLDNCSVYSRIGNQASILPEYWQPIPQKCSYVYLTSLEYFSVSLSGQGQQIIPDAVMFWDFTIASNSNVSGLMVIVLTLLIKCKWSFQLFLSKINNPYIWPR